MHVVLYNAFSGIPHPLTFMIQISSTRVDMLSHSTADTNDRFLQMFTKIRDYAYERITLMSDVFQPDTSCCLSHFNVVY